MESFTGGNVYFYTPHAREFASGVYDDKTGLVKFRNVHWYTNLDHGRRHQPLPLMSMADNLKFNKKIQKNPNSYKKYDNYNAIEVPYTNAIPSDYDGVMGVPISFLDKYNPEQFEILGITDRQNTSGLRTKKYTLEDTPKFNDLNARSVLKISNTYKAVYARILIKHKRK